MMSGREHAASGGVVSFLGRELPRSRGLRHGVIQPLQNALLVLRHFQPAAVRPVLCKNVHAACKQHSRRLVRPSIAAYTSAAPSSASAPAPAAALDGSSALPILSGFGSPFAAAQLVHFDSTQALSIQCQPGVRPCHAKQQRTRVPQKQHCGAWPSSTRQRGEIQLFVRVRNGPLVARIC